MVLSFVAPAVQAADEISFDFALYFAPKPSADAEAALKTLVEKQFQELSLSHDPKAVAHVSYQWRELKDYALPGEDSFKHFALGLQLSDRTRMAAAERAFIVSFSALPSSVVRTNQLACRLMANLAEMTAAHLWDEETRQIFSLAAWKAARVDGWQGEIPNVSKHVTMHAYKDPA